MDIKRSRFYLFLYEMIPHVGIALMLFGLCLFLVEQIILKKEYVMLFFASPLYLVELCAIVATYNKIKCFRYDLNTTLTLMDDDREWEYCSPQMNFRFKVGDIIKVHRLKMIYPYNNGINFIITFSDGRRIYLTYEANQDDVHELMDRVPRYLVTTEWRLFFKDEDLCLD